MRAKAHTDAPKSGLCSKPRPRSASPNQASQSVSLVLLLRRGAAGDVLQASVVLNALDALDVVAGLGDAPHGHVPRGGIVVVQALGTEVVPEGGRGEVGPVEGHLVEEVVGDVGRADLVMEEVEDAVGSVDGGKGALDPGPLVGAVLRHGGVGVLQPRVEDEPGVGPEVGTEVPKGDGEEAVVETDLEQEGHGGEAGGSRQCDLAADLGGEHLGAGAVVVHELPVLEGLAVVAEAAGGGQAEEVQRPPHGEVGEDLEGGEGSVAHGIMKDGVEGLPLVVRSEAVLGPGRRNVRLAVDEVVGAAVMLGVGVLPSVIRDEEGLVHDEAPNVVERLGRGEGAVAGLVGQHPVAGEDGAHPEGVEVPPGDPRDGVDAEQIFGKGRGQAGIGRRDQRHGHDGIAQYEPHAVDVRSLEAFLGNGRLDLSLGREGRRLGIGRIVRRDPCPLVVDAMRRLGNYPGLALGGGCVGTSSLAHDLFVYVLCAKSKRYKQRLLRQLPEDDHSGYAK
mmetsp:Transcript_32290/g.95123  ORF Transcript_32290/g.95123 Transcript_32290/m.95123 type:complete len:504 (+) Transcript_32290:144-1655(+)